MARNQLVCLPRAYPARPRDAGTFTKLLKTMVVHAGTCEAVSTLAFPVNREFIRQLRKNRPIAAKAGGQFSPMCKDLDAIPWEARTGNFRGGLVNSVK